MKRIIALTLILILSSTAIVFANDIGAIKENLTKYNIITDYEIGTINRAEAAKIIVTMMGMGECERTDTKFIDVPKEYWASGYINRAQEMGIINGHGDGTFKPEQKLTNEQFIKMLVVALGYEPTVAGTYPTGYFAKATQLGITRSLDLTGTDVALRSDVAVMVYNALDIPIMYQSGYGDVVTFVVADGKDGIEKITLRIKLDNQLKNKDNTTSQEYNGPEIVFYKVENNTDLVTLPDNQSQNNSFSGEEYIGRVLKISNLQKKNGTYIFENSLNENDNAKYIINNDTYVQITSNTVDIKNIKNDMYAQVWHYTDDKDEIEILKIELMKNKPSGI